MLLDNGDTEGCPTVFSEAMGHGLPVIGGTGAGADTAIIHGKNGYIVNVRNQEEMIHHIIKILENEKLRESMSAFGLEKLAKHHDPKKNGKALYVTVERIIKNKPATGQQLELNMLDKSPNIL